MSDQNASEAEGLASSRLSPMRRLLVLLRSPVSPVAGIMDGRGRTAALAGAGVFALLTTLLYTRIPSVLPGYPAVLVAFLIWAVAPGWLLQGAVFGTRDTGLIERAVVAFLMSMALAAAPALVALRLHWSPQTFALLYAGVAGVASALSLLWRRAEEAPAAGEETDGRDNTVLLALVIALALVGILSSPWWAGDRVPRDGDDLVYMGYVNEYVNGGALDPSKPFLDTRQGGFGRMAVNAWVVMEALLADNAGVEAFSLLMDYLPPLLTVLAVAAMFTLGRGLFRNTTVALLAAGFVLAFGVLDLSSHDGYGRNIFIRIAQDKMVATYVLVPVGLLLGARFLSKPALRTYFASTLAVIGLIVVHPMGVMFLVIGLFSLVALRALTERSLPPLWSGVLLLLPWAVLGIGFLLRVWLVEGLDADPLERVLRFRREFRLLDLPGGFVMGSHHLILHPFMMASLLAAPLVWLASRRDIGSQVVLATVLGAVLVSFVPILATPLAETASDHALWRLPRLIPVPLILACACYEVIWRLRPKRSERAVPARSALSARGSLLPIGALLLVTGGAFFVQEQHGIVDDGAYYDRFSDTAVLPWTGGSVFLGGFEHASLFDARPTPEVRRLIDYLEANVPPGSTVLVQPWLSNRYLPGMLEGIRPVDYRGAQDNRARRAVVDAFYDGSLRGPDLRAALEQYEVTHIAVGSGTRGLDTLRTFAELDASDFQLQEGAPEFVRQEDGVAADAYRAWAFDAIERERVGGARFTVPEDIDPEDAVLEFEILLVPSQPVVGDRTASLMLSYSKLGDGSATEGAPPVTDVYKKVALPDGTPSEAMRVRRRSVLETGAGGETHGLAVARAADTPIDTYPDDLWFFGLSVLYWPSGLELVDGTGYRVYRVVP